MGGCVRLVSSGWFEDTGAKIRIDWEKHEGPNDYVCITVKSKKHITSVIDTRSNTWYRDFETTRGKKFVSVWSTHGQLPPGETLTLGVNGGFVIVTLN